MIKTDKYELYKGDCLELMKDIPDKSVDMILCDLPYGTTRNKWDSIIPLDKLWKQYNRVIKDNGAIVLFGSQPFTTNLNFSNIKNYRYEWVWLKNNSTGFQLANKRPLKKHELISVFYKKQPTYNPQGLKLYGKINKRGSMGDNWNEMSSNQYVQQWTNYPTQILEFGYDKEKLHPTQKPVALLEYLIKTYTNDGEIVLDNCFGSGSTCLACLRTNRKFIGIEKDDKYFEIAINRINGYIYNEN
ncbi:DNA-methyltransferase (plasmid) [Clostridium perfringens]|uniref:DNA-methyltransferase n=1 Tax=Clostridium perfringens TaxID=1502 RepID=UPI00096A2B2C|nr:site-specific DNA-methyltransferase [Clostridium perfringens]